VHKKKKKKKGFIYESDEDPANQVNKEYKNLFIRRTGFLTLIINCPK
jgi:hypothetical protein